MKKILIIILLWMVAGYIWKAKAIMLKKTRRSTARIIAEEIARRKMEQLITGNDIEIADVIVTTKTELSARNVVISTSGTVYEIKEKDPATGGWLVGVAGIIAILISGIIYLFRRKQ